jgi:branched-chain amino acid transport system ATP-binding protein
MSLLEIQDVSVHYGHLKAVDHVSFTLDEGKILGIIGPNGAGKTSLIDALSGFIPLATGSVRLRGKDLAGAAPHVRARDGLVRTWQSVELYEDLTVWENLIVAADSPRWWIMLADIAIPSRRVAKESTAHKALLALGLEVDRDRMISELRHDRRKLVAIGRALASEPAVLLLDEPTAGLTTEETAALGLELRRIAGTGIGIVLIEHDMSLVLSVCDEILVVDFGRPLTQGIPDAVVSDPRVIEAYLGSSGHGSPAAEATPEAS